MFVSRLADLDGLVIRRGPNREPVIPLDLGFLNPNLRPAFHRLLQKFQPACSAWLPLEHAIQVSTYDRWMAFRKDHPDEPLPIIHTPRIVVEDRVIVARRRWRVPPENFPSTAPGESTDKHYVRVQEWRLLHGIPQRIFAKVQPCLMPPRSPHVPPPADSNQPVRRRNSVRDNHKPQFVDFTSPQLVDLFCRLRTEGQYLDVLIEEALPDLEHAWPNKNDHYLTEVVLQLSSASLSPLEPAPEVHSTQVHSYA